MSENKINFSFNETQPNLSTFYSRFNHFFSVTNPKNFFVQDQEIMQGVETVKKYRELAKNAPNGIINITIAEKQSILRGIELQNSSVNDKGELIFKPLRMCGFVPVNIPILCGLILSAPTIRNTIFFQWLNQSYNAGLNFGNKNSSCDYSNQDLFKGYCAAIFSSIGVALPLRYMTAPLVKTATGRKLLLLNGCVSGVAGACASFCNTYFMRKLEMTKGIDVFEDLKLKNKIGISKICATSAVQETAASRSCMSFFSVGFPTSLILMLGLLGLNPQVFAFKTFLDLNCIALGLLLGLPLSVSVFPPVSQKSGAEIEKEFSQYDKVYFSKGL